MLDEVGGAVHHAREHVPEIGARAGVDNIFEPEDGPYVYVYHPIPRDQLTPAVRARLGQGPHRRLRVSA